VTGGSPTGRRFALDASWRRPGGGRTVVAGSPLRLFRLTEGGARVAAALERGTTLPPGHERLTDRLLDAGAIHPVVPMAPGAMSDVGAPRPTGAADVTVVIPAFGASAAARLPAVVASCRAAGVAEVLVVDDASSPPLPAVDGARTIRLPANVGPGGARVAGLAEVSTPVVAFVDDDVELPDGWLSGLLGHLDDVRVALVAPRVTSSPTDSGVLAEYERIRGPLDLGPTAARVAAGTRVSYVPAAVLVCRAEAVRAIGAFDGSLRFGEDVDLVWRLVEAGHRARYEPAVVVHHHVRGDLRSWIRQRVGYGSSAAPLAKRHPGALAPVRMSGWSAATWACAATCTPIGVLTAAAVGGSTAVALVRKVPDLPAAESLRLALTGHWHAGRSLASAVVRAWWPIALVASCVSRRARWVTIAAAVLPALADDPRPVRRRARHLALRLLDDGAYGWGVWRGVVRARSLDAVTPAFGPWPPRTGG
jgi:mycofactocin system glycosyltransferase